MSIYHLTISNVSRAKGSSSCASLSYITAEKVHEDRTNQNYNYGSRKERVIAKDTFLPADAPEQYKNPSTLFNDLENFEKAENARTAKKIEMALPREFDLDTQKQVIGDYIKNNITSKGYACSCAIHCDKDGNNPHCHILIANRPLVQGEWAIKDKKVYQLDSDGNRIPVLDPNTGKQKIGAKGRKMWKRVSISPNLLDSKDYLQDLRKNWAEECNKHLDPAQHIDHRSYEDRGIDRLPTVHEGYAAKRLEALGHISERSELNRRIRAINDSKAELEKEKREYVQLDSEVKALEKEIEALKNQQNVVSQNEKVSRSEIPSVSPQKRTGWFFDEKSTSKTSESQKTHTDDSRASVSPQNVPQSVLQSVDYQVAKREQENHTRLIEMYEKDIQANETKLKKLDEEAKYLKTEIKKFEKEAGFFKKLVMNVEPAKERLEEIKKEKTEINGKLDISKRLLEQHKANKQIFDTSIKELLTGKRKPRNYTPSQTKEQTRTKTRTKPKFKGKGR